MGKQLRTAGSIPYSAIMNTLDLFQRHRAELIDYAAAIVGCRARAEDVVQEAYLRFNGVTERGHLSQPAGYLFRIVRNLAIDLVRQLALENRHVHDTVAPERAGTDPVTPETTLLHRAELQIVRDALAELPERTRLALEMYRFGGGTFKDIAQRLGISTTLAHALVHEGLAHCQQCLRERSS